MVVQHEIWGNVQMIKFPLDCTVKENRRVSETLGQDFQWVLMSMLSECKLWFSLLLKLKDLHHQISSSIIFSIR